MLEKGPLPDCLSAGSHARLAEEGVCTSAGSSGCFPKCDRRLATQVLGPAPGLLTQLLRGGGPWGPAGYMVHSTGFHASERVTTLRDWDSWDPTEVGQLLLYLSGNSQHSPDVPWGRQLC